MRTDSLLRVVFACALLTVTTACQPMLRPPQTLSTAATPVPQALPLPQSTTAPAKALPPEGHTVKTGDITTYYEEYGKGEPVIVLHGSLGSTADFASVIPALSKEFKLYVVDSRGRGRSTDSKLPLSYDLMMSDTLQLMDALGLAKATIVGWSDGAIIGIDMAIHHPDRVKSLVSYGGQYDVSGCTPFLIQFAETMTIDDVKDWATTYQAVSPHPERMDVILEKIRSMVLTQPRFPEAQVATIKVPTLVLDGEDEEIVQIDHAKALAKLIPNSELVLLKGVGHFAPYQKPDDFNNAVLAFLRKQ